MSDVAMFALGLLFGLTIGLEVARRSYAATAQSLSQAVEALDGSRVKAAVRAEIFEQVYRQSLTKGENA